MTLVMLVEVVTVSSLKLKEWTSAMARESKTKTLPFSFECIRNNITFIKIASSNNFA